jgi:hypothetical protein
MGITMQVRIEPRQKYCLVSDEVSNHAVPQPGDTVMVGDEMNHGW